MLASMKRCFLYGSNGSKIPLTANVRKIFNYCMYSSSALSSNKNKNKVHCWIVDKIIHWFYKRSLTDRWINWLKSIICEREIDLQA